jgi:hypothetical protein
MSKLKRWLAVTKRKYSVLQVCEYEKVLIYDIDKRIIVIDNCQLD